MTTILSAQPIHVLLHGGCQVEVQSNPTVTGTVTTRFSIKMSLMSWAWGHIAISQHSGGRSSNLSTRAKLIQNYIKRMIFLKVPFPLS